MAERLPGGGRELLMCTFPKEKDETIQSITISDYHR